MPLCAQDLVDVLIRHPAEAFADLTPRARRTAAVIAANSRPVAGAEDYPSVEPEGGPLELERQTSWTIDYEPRSSEELLANPTSKKSRRTSPRLPPTPRSDDRDDNDWITHPSRGRQESAVLARSVLGGSVTLERSESDSTSELSRTPAQAVGHRWHPERQHFTPQGLVQMAEEKIEHDRDQRSSEADGADSLPSPTPQEDRIVDALDDALDEVRRPSEPDSLKRSTSDIGESARSSWGSLRRSTTSNPLSSRWIRQSVEPMNYRLGDSDSEVDEDDDCMDSPSNSPRARDSPEIRGTHELRQSAESVFFWWSRLRGIFPQF